MGIFDELVSTVAAVIQGGAAAAGAGVRGRADGGPAAEELQERRAAGARRCLKLRPEGE
jgi:hypothetical protein